MRLRHSSSPLGSTGSSNESWPLLSKDEDAEMYSPHRHKINEVDDINRTDSEEQEDISDENDVVNRATYLLRYMNNKEKRESKKTTKIHFRR